MKLEELIGQRLVIGIPGTRVTPEIVRHFQELHAGGLILYRINFENPAQLKKLIAGLEEALGRKLLVMADHEGGRVIMFREGITVFPDNQALGTTGKIDYARQQGEIEAQELRQLGLDINLAPVLDVLTEAYSPNIGIRSYGRDWRLVARMGAARIAGMQKNGLSACAKHFPGKGHAPVDAHLGLPVINSTWAEMEASHLRPFVKAIESGVDLVMSSHPYYP
ncbi:MAG: glycoside hydrolase family 3 N-terminal domain-containing protein, partial [Syntrophales bacterium]|nr:glycoside hydrolase family 3 N-terminal domain-containing protein [Syntrophales bacterium]